MTVTSSAPFFSIHFSYDYLLKLKSFLGYSIGTGFEIVIAPQDYEKKIRNQLGLLLPPLRLGIYYNHDSFLMSLAFQYSLIWQPYLQDISNTTPFAQHNVFPLVLHHFRFQQTFEFFLKPDFVGLVGSYWEFDTRKIGLISLTIYDKHLQQNQFGILLGIKILFLEPYQNFLIF
jgi:hypothetical protein